MSKPICVKMATNATTVYSPTENSIKIYKWKVREGFQVTNNQVILLYELINSDDKEIKRLKSTKCGVVKKRYQNDGDTVDANKPLLELSECIHTTVIKDMCADCGADLRQDDNGNQSEASVPMLHSVPELKVTQKLAQKLGQADTAWLLKDRKLVLLVDLDQTIIHTTNDNIPNNLKDVYHFQLNGPRSPWYHTRLRPGTFDFLNNMAPYFELHICTFGARNYAHTIAQFLDEDGKYFSHRILSRDECLSLTSKTDNLKALFPCGDSMVCIIDDREDVWNMATNLIQVKPYHFFQHTGDINAPPGMSKHELDGKGVDFKDLQLKLKRKAKDSKKTIEPSTELNDKLYTNEGEITNKSIDVETKSETDNKVDPDEKKTDDETKSNDEKMLSPDSEGPDVKVDESTVNQNDASEEKKFDEKSEEPSINIGSGDEEPKKPTSSGTIDDNLIEIDDPDDYLMYLETILKKIHARFYEFYDETKQIPDLKTLVPKIRSEVLVGKTLVFSGLVPNQIKLEKSRAYMIARSLGASVTQQLTDDTTHLVASTAGTFKVNAARKSPHIKIVSPEWLWTCAERWECVEEQLFPLDSKKASKTRQPPAHCHSPEHVVNYNIADSAVANSESQSSSSSDEKLKFIDTINPLLTFSNDELVAMNEDVDLDSSSSDEDSIDYENPPVDKRLRKRKRDEENEEAHQKIFKTQKSSAVLEEFGQSQNDNENSNTESSEDDIDKDEESPSVKFRRGEDLPSDLDMGSNCGSNASTSDDQGDDGDWNMMGAALEREFLGLE